MQQIYQKIENNMINYGSIPMIKSILKDICRISVIVPLRGRKRFVSPLMRSFMKAQKPEVDTCITIVEHSPEPESSFVKDEYSVNYIHIPCAEEVPFNKCLAMNVGALFSAKAQYFLFHDADLIVRSDFFLNIDKNVEKKKCKAIQTFDKRRVLNCPSMLTEDIINDKVNFDDFKEGWRGIYDHGRYGAPGGSIMVHKDIFFKVGGFDPELWHSYSPEDLFFWDKINLFTNMETCDSPANEVFHLHHELQQKSNPEFRAMMVLYKMWYRQGEDEKMKICDYKRDLIKEYER